MKKTILITIILIAVLGLGIYLAGRTNAPAVSTNDLAGVPGQDALIANMKRAGLDQLGAEGTVMHIHEHLDIIVNGKNIEVPAEIGIGSGFISPIHTHDTTGVIHIESPVKKDFTLGQFFTEWGIDFSDNRIANYTADQINKMIVAVNGKPITDAADYVLKPHDEIEVWYGPKTDNPDFISSYNFPAGL